MKKNTDSLIIWAVILIFFIGPALLTFSGNSNSSDSSPSATVGASSSKSSASNSSSSKSSTSKQDSSKSFSGEKSKNSSSQSKDTAALIKSLNNSIGSAGSKSSKSKADSRWPTTNSELLKIKKKNRWYNAYKHIGTRWTAAGRVEEIYTSSSSYGSPTFVDIGVRYPDPNKFTIVIWEEDMHGFQSTLNNLYEGSSWIKITGYVSEYDGRAQIDLGDGAEWTYWQ